MQRYKISFDVIILNINLTCVILCLKLNHEDKYLSNGRVNILSIAIDKSYFYCTFAATNESGNNIAYNRDRQGFRATE